MSEFTIPIPARLKNMAINGHVAGTEDIIDDALGKTQKEINTETSEKIEEIKGGSTDSIASLKQSINNEKERAENVEEGLSNRLSDVEQLAEISLDGGEAKIATGEDFDNPTAEQRTKIPTVGAVLDGADDEPTVGSKNLVESGGVENVFRNIVGESSIFSLFGYIILSDGSENNNYEYIKKSDYIYLDSISNIVTESLYEDSTRCIIAFYDKDKKYISGIAGNGSSTPSGRNVISASNRPINAVYVRFCTNASYVGNAIVFCNAIIGNGITSSMIKSYAETCRFPYMFDLNPYKENIGKYYSAANTLSSHSNFYAIEIDVSEFRNKTLRMLVTSSLSAELCYLIKSDNTSVALSSVSNIGLDGIYTDVNLPSNASKLQLSIYKGVKSPVLCYDITYNEIKDYIIYPSFTKTTGYINSTQLKLSNESEPWWHISPVSVKKGDIIIIDGGRTGWCSSDFSVVAQVNQNGSIKSNLLSGDATKKSFYYVVKKDGYVSSSYVQYSDTLFSLKILRVPGIDSLIQTENKINIVCDGDSLTWGALYDGSQSETNYPAILQELLGDYYDVHNFGVPGATSCSIVGIACGFRTRDSGILPAVAKDTVQIPLSMFRATGGLATTKFGVPYYTDPSGNLITGGANPVLVNGIKCTALEYSDQSSTTLRRLDNGDSIYVSNDEVVITNEAANFKGCTHIINIGTNRGFLKSGNNDINSSDNIAELKAQYDCIINMSDELYIVISPHGFLGNSNIGAWSGESVFEDAYGSHYINSRKYFSEHGISDAISRGYLPNDGTYPTAQDEEDIQNGKCPSSLLEQDGVHLSSVGYHLLGDLVAKTYKNLIRLKSLGNL